MVDTNKKKPTEDPRVKQFFKELDRGAMTIPQTVRMLRKATGMTIPEYAVSVGLSARYLGDIERGLMNPTVEILERIGQPFGLVVAMRRKGKPAP